MQLKSIKINPKNIKFTAVYNADSDNVEAEEERKITCVEMPKPEFGEALQHLTIVVVAVMGFQGSYVNGMIVEGFGVSYTKNGTRSMEIYFSKVMDKLGGKPHKMKTPFFRIEEPADGDDGSLEVDKKHANFCLHALDEAVSYAKGDRSQQTFIQFAEENGALEKADQQEALI